MTVLPARLIVPPETETVPVGSAAARIESLVPARVRALPPADRLKVVGVAEVAARARTSVPLLRVIGAAAQWPGGGTGALPDRHEVAAVDEEFRAAGKGIRPGERDIAGAGSGERGWDIVIGEAGDNDTIVRIDVQGVRSGDRGVADDRQDRRGSGAADVQRAAAGGGKAGKAHRSRDVERG